MTSNFEILIRIGLACILGGVIGIEREKNRHPAGLRTHILVCIGAALVMLSNVFLFYAFKSYANIDPARLGAQVISGIGFLGAGTIIKEGISVKGLTTAASLWAVGCIGIAVGVGFYTGAILTTAFVLITLIIISRFEHVFYKKSNKISIVIRAEKNSSIIDLISESLKNMEIHITNISTDFVDHSLRIAIRAVNTRDKEAIDIVRSITFIEGVNAIEICD